MRFWGVILLAGLLGWAACSKKKPDGITPDRVTSAPDGKWHLDGKPWSGKHVNKHTNGKTSFEGDLIDGQPHGDWTWYYESGNVKSRLVFELGIKNGNETHYYDNDGNTQMWMKTWKRGSFAESFQWQEDGSPILPHPRADTNGTPLAVP
jgi:hypothetical protein